jgi:hypothetical protein
LPALCYDCHASAYQGTTDPAHAAAGFPTTCETCHGTAAWEPSTWDHEILFPIRSGPHRDVWSTCATCHVNPGDYAVFACINCHEHNRTETDAHHREVREYRWESNACYTCHPRGRKDD